MLYLCQDAANLDEVWPQYRTNFPKIWTEFCFSQHPLSGWLRGARYPSRTAVKTAIFQHSNEYPKKTSFSPSIAEYKDGGCAWRRKEALWKSEWKNFEFHGFLGELYFNGRDFWYAFHIFLDIIFHLDDGSIFPWKTCYIRWSSGVKTWVKIERALSW